jgi:hypothetical protein
MLRTDELPTPLPDGTPAARELLMTGQSKSYAAEAHVNDGGAEDLEGIPLVT